MYSIDKFCLRGGYVYLKNKIYPIIHNSIIHYFFANCKYFLIIFQNFLG